MHKFSEYCQYRDLNEVDLRQLAQQGWQNVKNWWNPVKKPEKEYMVGGKPVKLSDLEAQQQQKLQGTEELDPTERKITSNIAKNYALKIQNRITPESLRNALINYGYRETEADDIVDKNPQYLKRWNDYLNRNARIKQLYLSSRNQPGTLQGMLKSMFDAALGLNTISKPEIVTPKPEPEIVTQEKKAWVKEMAKEAKVLFLQGHNADKIKEDLYNKHYAEYWRNDGKLSVFKGLVKKAVNMAHKQMIQNRELGPLRLVSNEPKLRLWQQ